ncbi:MAG: hypothetical protein GXY33_22180 [Phycisphaerae bacterium]|nr:hypothetical protein [Phycisphaerae bacterium]
MNPWRGFYSQLGIDETLEQPSPYQLLGLERGDCSAEIVDAALESRRQLLRKQVRSPQMLPLLLQFEKQQLEPAAAVLRDSARRREYDAKPDIEAPQPEDDAQRVRRLVVEARAAILAAVDKRGALAAEKRDDLARRLLALGIPRCDVPTLLARIPQPNDQSHTTAQKRRAAFKKQVQAMFPEGYAGDSHWDRLIALGKVDGLEEQTARQVLEECLGEPRLPRLPALRIDVPEKSDPDSLPILPADLARSRARKRRTANNRLAAVGIPLVGIAAFLAILYAFGDERTPEARSAVPPPIETPTDVPPAIPQPSSTPIYTPAAPPSPIEQEAAADEIATDNELTIDPQSDFTEQIRAAFGPADSADQLLADTAIALLAACERLASMNDSPQRWPNDLAAALGAADRVTDLAERISFRPVQAADLNQATIAIDLEQTAHDLASSDAVCYQAVEKLRQAAMPEATDLLLSALEQRCTDLSTRGRGMTSRILRALLTIEDPRIPRDLAQLIARSRPFAAHQIVQTLAAGSGVRLAAGSEGLLALANNAHDRLVSQRWWTSQLSGGRAAQWGRQTRTPGAALGLQAIVTNLGPAPGEPNLDSTPAAWEPDQTPLKLLGLNAHLSAAMAELLRNVEATGEPSGLPTGVIFRSRNVGTDFASSLDEVCTELELLIRTEAPASPQAAALDLRRAERHARLAACRTVLQRIAVNMDAAGELLELLAQARDRTGRLAEPLAQLADDRRQAQREADDVLQEIRAAACHNLHLCDVLARQKAAESRVAQRPDDGRVRHAG